MSLGYEIGSVALVRVWKIVAGPMIGRESEAKTAA